MLNTLCIFTAIADVLRICSAQFFACIYALICALIYLLHIKVQLGHNGNASFEAGSLQRAIFHCLVPAQRCVTM